MMQGALRELLPDGSVRLTSGESAFVFARPTSGVLVVTITHDHEARRRSYELIAGAFALERSAAA